MKTWTAALAHIGLGAAQAAAGMLWFEPNTMGGVMANTGIQFGSQFGLAVLQVLLAKKNSNTDPQGKPLAQTIDNKYVTSESKK